MKLTKREKETIIVYNEEEATASIVTYNERLLNKLSKLESISDDCCRRQTGNNSMEYVIPKSWVKINMPRQYSEEQRREMAERARKNLAKKI